MVYPSRHPRKSPGHVSKLYQVAEIELIYKTNVQASQRPKIASSRDAYNVLIQSCSRTASCGRLVHDGWNPDSCSTTAVPRRLFHDGGSSVALEFIEEFKILLLNNASRVLGIFEFQKAGFQAQVPM